MKPMPLRWTREYKQYHFEIFYHVGRECYGIEVYDYKKDWLAESTLGFNSFDESYSYLAKYGFHNTGRFINDP